VADYTVTALLASLKRRGMLPASEEALSDDDYLEFANDELFSYIVPEIEKIRADHFVVTKDISVTAGTDTYDIPDRAMGGRLKFVKISDGNGGYADLTMIEPERSDEFSTLGDSQCFYIQDYSIVLVPEPTAATTLRVGYYQRLGRLVPVADCTYVAGTYTNETQLFGTTPAGWQSLVATDKFDIVSTAAPGFKTLYKDLDESAVAAGNITFTTAVTTTASTYVCMAGESPIPQIPPELHPWLAARVVVRACEALGLQQKLAAAEGTAERLRLQAQALLAPRVDEAPRVIVNRNAPGFRKNRGFRWR
jgi:hypothetical protein